MISRCKQHHERNFKVTCKLILLCGDVALNPGPNYKYPCGICSKPVKCNQKGISCETCDTWYHAKCSNIPDTEYLALSNNPDPWCCNDCILPDIDCFQDTAPPGVHTPGSRASTSSTRTNSSTLGDSLLKNMFMKGLTICHMNIRSLPAHYLELQVLLLDKPVQVLVITETFPTSNHSDADYPLDGYTLYRKDRELEDTESERGGVAMYIDSTLPIKRRNELDAMLCESL